MAESCFSHGITPQNVVKFTSAAPAADSNEYPPPIPAVSTIMAAATYPLFSNPANIVSFSPALSVSPNRERELVIVVVVLLAATRKCDDIVVLVPSSQMDRKPMKGSYSYSTVASNLTKVAGSLAHTAACEDYVEDTHDWRSAGDL